MPPRTRKQRIPPIIADLAGLLSDRQAVTEALLWLERIDPGVWEYIPPARMHVQRARVLVELLGHYQSREDVRRVP